MTTRVYLPEVDEYATVLDAELARNFDQITTGLYLITPEGATVLIEERNHGNRRIHMTRVEEYASEIRDDRWKVNGDTIGFRRDGKLNNGQHRLLACVQAGKPFATYVIMGLPNDSFMTVDTGLRKTVGDLIGMRGDKYETAQAGICRLQFQDVNGGAKALPAQHIKPSHTLIWNIREAHPGIAESAEFAARACGKVVSPTQGGFVHYHAAQRAGRAVADEFFLRLGDGIGLPANSPILALKSRLESNRRAKAKLSQTEILALVIKAWNAYVQNREIKQLKFDRREEFPDFA